MSEPPMKIGIPESKSATFEFWSQKLRFWTPVSLPVSFQWNCLPPMKIGIPESKSVTFEFWSQKLRFWTPVSRYFPPDVGLLPQDCQIRRQRRGFVNPRRAYPRYVGNTPVSLPVSFQWNCLTPSKIAWFMSLRAALAAKQSPAPKTEIASALRPRNDIFIAGSVLRLVAVPVKVFNLFVILTMILAIAACGTQSTPQPDFQEGQEQGKKTYSDLVVGFAQIGAESEWRTGNTASIKEAAEDLGVELKFSDAQQKQENQIKAIRVFIAQQVDVIGVSPVVETGWESVFQEAKDAGIPIILVDRRAAVSEDLYVTSLGSDFLEEGRNAARVMVKLLNGKGKIVELVGTVGSAPANDRYQGFREILRDYPEMEIIASAPGDFTRAKGKEVMESLLKRFGKDIDALYAHNDDMAIGAIKAIEAYGLRPGQDIKIVSIDAVRDAFKAMVDGKLNATIECNPLLGRQFFELALKVVNHEPVPKWIPSTESIYYPDNAAEILPTRRY